MEPWGFVSVFLGGTWFVLNNFLTGYRDFKKETREAVQRFNVFASKDHCDAQHSKIKEEIIDTLYK
jgi:tRNA A37 N6-isopentenylltransferase MiaA